MNNSALVKICFPSAVLRATRRSEPDEQALAPGAAGAR